MSDDFQLVVRPKRRQKFRKCKQIKGDRGGPVVPDCEQSEQTVLYKLEQCRDEIKGSEFYVQFKDILLKKISESLLSCHYDQFSISTDNKMIGDNLKDIPPEHRTKIESDFRYLLTLHNDKTQHEVALKEESLLEKMQECITRLARFKLELVTYGIGNFAECKIAQYQLALMMVIFDLLKLTSYQCYTYDPVWSDVEKSVIQSIGSSLISKNEEGKRRCECNKVTLFLMPHCGTALYNNLLWANWGPSHLTNLIIVGNSFHNIIQRHPDRVLQEKAAYIHRIFPAIDEVMLPNTFVYSDIFNDTAIHCFSRKRLKKLPEDLWRDIAEPEYDPSDVEIILNK
ncbi:SRR1-like protein [Argonauta hians]